MHGAIFRHTDRVTLRGELERVIEVQHAVAITTYPELRYLLEDAGFRVEALLASTRDRDPIEHLDGSRMVIVARASSD